MGLIRMEMCVIIITESCIIVLSVPVVHIICTPGGGRGEREGFNIGKNVCGTVLITV